MQLDAPSCKRVTNHLGIYKLSNAAGAGCSTPPAPHPAPARPLVLCPYTFPSRTLLSVTMSPSTCDASPASSTCSCKGSSAGGQVGSATLSVACRMVVAEGRWVGGLCGWMRAGGWVSKGVRRCVMQQWERRRRQRSAASGYAELLPYPLTSQAHAGSRVKQSVQSGSQAGSQADAALPASLPACLPASPRRPHETPPPVLAPAGAQTALPGRHPAPKAGVM